MTAALRFGATERSAAELEDRGRRLAGGLAALGLKEGDVVAVLLRNDPVYFDVIHACRIGGFTYCPVNWHFTPAEIGFLVSDSGARAIIGHADLLAAAGEVLPQALPVLAVGATLAAGLQDYEGWLAASGRYAGPVVSPRGHMAYTSGTTGRPKGIVRQAVPLGEAEASQQRARAVAEIAFGIKPGCRALIPAPLYHSAPSLIAQMALQQAELVVLTQRFREEEVLELIEEHRIDVVYLVPTMYVRLLKLPAETRARHDLSSLRFVASTGAPCAPQVKRAMIDWLGPVIHETYASSESGMITVIGSQEALARPGSSGRPIGEARIAILTEDGRDCATGEIGLIYVRQPAYPDFVYRNQPDARGKIDRDGLITLGDMGYLDPDGYLYVCDRASDMVISGGVNIYPAEIEHALVRLPGVLDCAVIGIPDDEFGEQLLALVLPEPGATPVPAELAERLRQTIAGYKVPRRIEIVDALPRDDNGKIAKRRLRDAYWAKSGRQI
ncbi:AMP-binding protein [Phreatobacter stygius]|uniref:Long-chain fatty acid--CoA ligase n=1 Tax=Phreatobacter stygius TaxID=1940610 RepID=A0A4D7AW04_9HYPH|nr:AMP-binding protein [Phreatobacter stygius]QCI65854.1 long-chain fatty acid--CoA ligase [Phreatobacter stygius]